MSLLIQHCHMSLRAPIPSITCVHSQPQLKALFALIHEGESDTTTISPRFQLPSAGREDSHRDLNQHPPALPTDTNVYHRKEQRADKCRY